ncbi:ribosome assembly protein SQT1, partial [Phenoliferia sp. Uapishka_3]
MSEQDDVVQRLDGEDGTFLTEDDVLEVEELEIDNDGMDVESDDGGDEEDGEGRDGADDLLDNGYDDSKASFLGHDGGSAAIFAVALHPLNPLLAVSGGEDDLAHLWRTDTGAEICALSGHTDSVTSVGFSFDGEMLATGGMDGRVRVWRRVKGSEGFLSWEFLTNLEGPDEVNWLDWHPKGNLLLAGGADGTVWLWSLPTGNTLHVLSGHIDSVTCGRFTPDGLFSLFIEGYISNAVLAKSGKKIVTCSADSVLILWDPRTGEAVHKLLPADARFRLDGGINAVAINTAGTVAICGGAQGGLRAVNLVQGTVLAQMAGHEDGSSIEAVAFSEVPVSGAASVTVLVSVGTDGRVCTWEANNFKLRSTGLHEDAVTSIAFAPGTTHFVTASADKTLKVWDYRRGSCEQTLLGHRDVIHSCAISRDGKLIVSGGDDCAKVFLTGEQAERAEPMQS